MWKSGNFQLPIKTTPISVYEIRRSSMFTTWAECNEDSDRVSPLSDVINLYYQRPSSGRFWYDRKWQRTTTKNNNNHNEKEIIIKLIMLCTEDIVLPLMLSYGKLLDEK